MDSFLEYLRLAFGVVFVSNFVLAQFLGLCPFLGVSKKQSSALGMGFAVIFVMALASVVCHLLLRNVLLPMGLEGFLQISVFILVIAALVQFVEMVIKKTSPGLYTALGIYLPLITTNCAVLGVAALNSSNGFADPARFGAVDGLLRATVQGTFGGVGFMLGMYLMSNIREDMEGSPYPASLKGFPIAFVLTASMALAFLGFSGMFAPEASAAAPAAPAAPAPAAGAVAAAPTAAGLAGWGGGVLAVLGAALGLLLYIASRVFAIQTDPKVDAIMAALPGANCGGCGLAGCAAYAEMLVKSGGEVNLCGPGGSGAAKKIAEILGVSFDASDRRVSVLACRGTCEFAAAKHDYAGVADCRAAALVHGGAKACRFGCLGLGTCATVCPYGAIVMGADGLPHVVEELCTACGKCVTACPRELFRIAGEKQTVRVACTSHDPGKETNRVCKVGCIACRRCEKSCKFEAIKVTDNLAVIDYSKCKLCGACVKACPRGIIVNYRAARKARRDRLAAAGQGQEAAS
ncbi:MAG TPA: RnfABCDGE type electron transport complex subunit B [Planctomycetota bacterium]|nr:RnfABCDGE type electron transport complex subunit B [Planctomycetota bacterium]